MSDPFGGESRGEAPFVSREYNPDRWREWIRGAVTLSALLIFAVIVFRYFNASLRVNSPEQWSMVKDATAVIFPAVTSVLGSAMGFYFGSQQKK